MLVAIPLLLYNCNENDFHNLDTNQNQLEENPIKLTIKKFSDLENDSKFNDAIERIIKPVEDNETKHSNTYNRTIMEDEYGFTIDSSTVKQIDINDFTSYTMLIHRGEHSSGFFENLVVQVDSLNEISAYIVKYIPTSDYSYYNIHDSYSFEGDVEISPIVYNATESTANKMVYSCSNFYQLKCNGGNNGNCNGAYHDPGPQCYEEYNPCIGLVQTGQTCGYSDDGSGGGGGDASNPGGDDGDGTADDCATCGVNGENTNSTEAVIEENAVITTPVNEVFTPHCKQLKDSISDVPLIKTRLNQLRVAATSGNFEKGLRIDKNPDTGVYSPREIQNSNNGSRFVKITVIPYTVVVAHTHPIVETYAMFSGPDIIKMAQIIKSNQSINSSTVAPLSVTHILIAAGKTFALRFDDAESAQKLLGIYNNPKEKSKFIKRLKYLYDKDYGTSGLSNTTIYKQQHHLFTLFEEFGLNMSLYQANYDANGLVDNWQKINKETLAKQTCK